MHQDSRNSGSRPPRTDDKRGARGRALRRCGSRAFRSLSAVLLTAVFLLAVLPPASARINTTVTAREETGYGRLVIEFDRLPGHKNELAAGVFVLLFDAAVKIDLTEVPELLPDYVSLARPDPDGRGVRLALSRTFKVNVMEAGKKLFVDIMPPSWTGPPPILPSEVMRELARVAAEAEEKAREEERQRRLADVPHRLKIRLARHPTFSRIVFDWNKFVAVNLARAGSLVTLKFGQTAPADLSRLNVDGPKFLRSAVAKTLDTGMAVELTVDDDVDVRGFREGLTYVVDLTGPERAAEASVAEATKKIEGAAAEQAERTEKAQGEQPAGARRKDQTRLAAETAAAEPSADDSDAPPMSEFETSVADLDPSTHEDNFGDWGAASRLPSTLRPAAPSGRAKPRPRDEPRVSADEKPAETTEPRERPAAAAGEAPAETAVPVVVRVQETGANLRLVFPFDGPVSGAVFHRGRTIWLVFDSDALLDAAALRDPPGNKIVDVHHVRSGSMQYFRLTLSRPWFSYVSHNRDAWSVDIGDLITGEAKRLNLKRALRRDNQSIIRIALENSGRVHWLKDPEVGDRLAVATAFAPPRSVAKTQDFVDFTAIETTHGIAIRPNSDDVGVRRQLDEIIITRHTGLTLSAGYARQYVPGKTSLDPSARAGFLDFATWEVKDPGLLSGRIHHLQRAIAVSPAAEKNGLRFALARLYLANGLHAETLGVMRRLALADPAIINDPAFNMVRGAAHVLTRRTAEAQKDLRVHALANDRDAALWRGLMRAHEKQWQKALRSFDDGSLAIEAYRPDVQARFRLAATRAALELGKQDRAADELDALPETKLPRGLDAEANLLRGRYLAAIGQDEAALEAFEAVREGTVRPAVAEAELRRTTLLLRMKRISDAEALKSLERLQLVWRGDDIELGTNRLLASLYVKQAKYREAFAVMKNTVIAFPKAKLALQIQDEMKEVFKDLYINAGSDTLKPIDALSLYYEHRELTPVGRLGDEMIRRLSDRLVSFDLLDQAAELLDHQVRKRLKGAARAQVATRLAMVHLMNRKPDLALRVIRRTRQAGLPSTLQRNRNLLEARALGELGRAESAIEILSTMKGSEVERLKSDALWTAQRWQQSGEQIEKMLAGRWQKPEPLDGPERFDVLRAAISYALANDQFALDRLRKKFHTKMLKTPDAEAFGLVTRRVKSRSVNFRRLAKDIAATDTLDAFMKDFRKRFNDPEDSGAG